MYPLYFCLKLENDNKALTLLQKKMILLTCNLKSTKIYRFLFQNFKLYEIVSLYDTSNYVNNLKRAITIYFTIYMFENNFHFFLLFVVRMIHLFFGNQILYLEKESAIYVLVIDFRYFYFDFFFTSTI